MKQTLRFIAPRAPDKELLHKGEKPQLLWFFAT
jgi:hypothetical protein